MSNMYMLVLLVVVAQVYAQNLKLCPILVPNIKAVKNVPSAMYDNFVPNTMDNRNLDSVCYRIYQLRSNLYVAQMTKINTTGSVVGLKFSLYLQVLPGLTLLTPGFESNPGIFSRTVLNYSGCNSELSYSCSSVGNVTSYALGTTTTPGQSFQKCAKQATALLTGGGLAHPSGYIALPQKHVSKCVFNFFTGLQGIAEIIKQIPALFESVLQHPKEEQQTGEEEGEGNSQGEEAEAENEGGEDE